MSKIYPITYAIAETVDGIRTLHHRMNSLKKFHDLSKALRYIEEHPHGKERQMKVVCI